MKFYRQAELSEHEALAREVIKAGLGREVARAGDPEAVSQGTVEAATPAAPTAASATLEARVSGEEEEDGILLLLSTEAFISNTGDNGRSDDECEPKPVVQEEEQEPRTGTKVKESALKVLVNIRGYKDDWLAEYPKEGPPLLRQS